jgi:DNA-binding beta-propeller fold protein YncE
MFETCTTGSGCQAGQGGGGAGQLDSPDGIALDGAGNLYVADEQNQRIDVFATAGPSFVRAFGWDVALPDGDAAFEACPAQGACQMGDSGGGAGQFDNPFDVAVDGAGSLYVTEGNDRIDVFGTAGPTFTRAFAWGVETGASAFEVCTTGSGCQAGIGGAGAGDLDSPTGVAVDGSGSLYVSDFLNSRISTFGTAGPSFTRAFGWGVDTGASMFQSCTTASSCQTGIAGSGVGQIKQAYGVAVDRCGAVWLSDSSNNRLQRFGEAGTPSAPPCTASAGGGGAGGAATPISAPTGQRAAALKKCQKKHGKKRKKCKRKAILLPA